MDRSVSLVRTRSAILACAALALGGMSQPAAAAVSMSASSAQVSNPGDFGTICVALATNGESVAGTQNDLSWDGACATLDESNCSAAGTHGKQLSGKLIPQRDFVYRALVLSLTDVDPIDDGLLYCCRFQAEAAPGQCCDIKMSNAQASDPRGEAIAALTNTAKLCVSNSGSSGGPVGNVGRSNQPLSASNAGAGGEAPAAAAQPAAPAAGNAPPASQVLQGGGAQAPAPAAAPAGGAPDGAAAGDAAAGEAEPGAAAPALSLPGVAALATAVAPTMAAATVAAATAAAPQDTPTEAIEPTAPPTVAPTKAAAKPAAAAPAAAAKDSGGLFGCQVASSGIGFVPLAGAAALWVLGAALRRRRRRLTRHSNRNED